MYDIDQKSNYFNSTFHIAREPLIHLKLHILVLFVVNSPQYNLNEQFALNKNDKQIKMSFKYTIL